MTGDRPARGFGVHFPHLDRLAMLSEVSTPERFRRLAEECRVKQHRVTEDAGNADMVLFTEAHILEGALGDWRLEEIRRHRLRKQYPEKCYVYDERDQPWCALPGLYVSQPRRSFIRRYQVASPYGSVWPSPAATSGDTEPDLLFSFVGSPTALVREAIYDLRHGRAAVERVTNFTFWDAKAPDFEERRDRFRDVLQASKFILCPRGQGTSSIRLYETLASGRVPVILADDWVAPIGPDWDRCSVRWPERLVAQLPSHLERIEGDWPEMASAVRETHRQWLAPDIMFHRLIESLRPLVESDVAARFPASGIRRTAVPRGLRKGLSRTKHFVLGPRRQPRGPVGVVASEVEPPGS